MLTISRFARGLTSLLALKEGGLGPRELSGVIAATVDIREFLLLDGRETLPTATNAAPAVGPVLFGTESTVPSNELWYLWSYTVQGACGAGDAIDLCPAIAPDGTTLISQSLGVYQAAAANQNVRAFMERPFWALPGSRILAHARSVTGAPPVNGGAVITRLRL